MLDESFRILIAAVICWLNFMTVDLIFQLTEYVLMESAYSNVVLHTLQ